MFQVSRVAYHPSARVFKTSYCMFNGLGFFGCWEVDCFLLSGVGDGMLFFSMRFTMSCLCLGKRKAWT